MEHTENWKDVVGWPEYMVSDTGVIRYKATGKIRKPRIEKLGYHSVDLWRNNYMKRLKVHRMVALAFIDNPLNKPQVNHIDGDKNNNKVSNLEWTTAKENSQHAYATGLSKPIASMKHGRRKLNDIEACFIYHSELPAVSLCEEFGVSRRLVNKIKQGKLWRETTKLSLKGAA
jgi:hypothetical protein